MVVIGLCGGSGAGKGYIGEMLEARGIPVIDTDAVYHRLIQKKSACTDALSGCFGRGILDSAGGVDRKALGSLVFEHADALVKLNEIAHKYILNAVRATLAAYKNEGYAAAAVDAPLLYESGFERECDFVIAVHAPQDIRIARIISRDGISEQAAKKRIAAQEREMQLAAMADYILHNGCGDDPSAQLDKILAARGLLPDNASAPGI